MSETQAVNYQQRIPDVMKALSQVHDLIDQHWLGRQLHHLILLRASQLNRCGYCVEMHTREAREDGESSERLDQLIVWDQTDLFDPAEQAALAWTEALTELKPGTDYGALRSRLRRHFSEQEISAITATVGMINLWNRIGISSH